MLVSEAIHDRNSHWKTGALLRWRRNSPFTGGLLFGLSGDGVDVCVGLSGTTLSMRQAISSMRRLY